MCKRTLKKVKKLAFIILIFTAIFNFIPTSAQAIDLIIQEGKVRLSIAPGGTKAGTIHLRNTSSEPTAVRAYFEDWYYLPGADGSKEFKPAGTMPLSCASWVNFTPAEFTVPPFADQIINYIVKVPKDVVGGHYAVLFFETILTKPMPEGGVGVSVAVRLGSLFYIEPEGTIKREISIDNLSLERSSESEPLIVNLSLKNTGNTDITAYGNFDLMDKTGMVYARGKFDEAYTFPGDKAALKGEWREPISAGKYDLIITLDLGKALEEAEMGRGPIIVKEADVEIGSSGEVLSVSALR
jgi:hypothetical protein